MACRTCGRHFSQVARQAHALPNVETRGIIATRQWTRQIGSQAEQKRMFRSLAQNRKSWVPQPVKNAAASLLKSTAAPYQVHAATENIYKACAHEAAYTISETDKRNGTVQKTEEGEEIGKGTGAWHTDFGLPPTFSTWSQVTMLHMYLVSARIRNLDRDSARSWQRQLVDHFFFDAEERMDVTHGITSRGLRHRYLKDIFIQWRGIIAAYDEGVIKGDAVLASAVWRNIYKGREDVDVRHVAAIVSWMRLCLKMLDEMSDELLFMAPEALKWPAMNELTLVDQPSREIKDLLRRQPSLIPREPVSRAGESAPIQKVAV